MKSKRQNTRSEDRGKHTLEKLKAENRKLRKKISQLQKELSKYNQFDIYSEEDNLQIEESKPGKKDCCERCKECDIQHIPAGIFMIRICNNCGYKKRKKVDFK